VDVRNHDGLAYEPLMRFVSLSCVAVFALLCVLAPRAGAQSCKARPGSAAVEQYCEAIPSASGDQLSAPDSQTSPGGRAVSSSTAATLRKAGPDGAAVLSFVGGQARGAGNKTHASTAAGASAPIDASLPRAPSNNPLKAVASAADTGPTAGGGLVWVLLGGAVAVAGLGWRVFRRGR
jgi:hypothetical protein